MTPRLVLLTEIISPYRIPLFNTLAKRGKVDLHVIFLAETDPGLRQWQVYKQEIKFSYEVLPSWRKRIGKFHALINGGVTRALNASSPAAILCGGYNYLASWEALLWARTHNVPLLLWSESNLQDLRGGHALVEFIKDEYLQRCSGFVAPGKTAREYLRAHKISDRLIFTAPNAIDNDFFTRAAAEARRKAPGLREELHLPDRYFLFVGRLVREKGVFELLSAYAKLDQQVRRQVGLVLAGDGTLRHQLQEQAASIFPGTVTFAGFVHREQLPVYYALAETLVLPTYSDTWGLVVNEAMACGLPVILSRAAGCAADLLIENRNGMLVSPRDVTSLANAMQSLACAPDLRANMAADSLRHIGDYSAAGWSVGVEGAVEAMGVNHD